MNIPSTIGSATKQWTRYDSLRSVTECESSFKRRTSLFSNIIQSNKTLFTTTCNYRRNKTSNHTDNKIIFYVNSPRELRIYQLILRPGTTVYDKSATTISIGNYRFIFLPRCYERFGVRVNCIKIELIRLLRKR